MPTCNHYPLRCSFQTGQTSFELNTRINGAHDADINSLTFVDVASNLGLLTCGGEGKAKLWLLGEGSSDKSRGKQWNPVRTFSHVGRIPRCAGSSRDRSVLGIGFDSQITLWSTETLALISTLSTKATGSEVYSSLAFISGHLLLAANRSSVHVWSLLNNQLTHRMALNEPKLFKSPRSVEISSGHGIFVVDDAMKLKCLTKNVSRLTRLACSESRCFVVQRDSENR